MGDLKLIRVAAQSDLSAIILLKLKMFQEVGMEEILRADFIQEVERTYKERTKNCIKKKRRDILLLNTIRRLLHVQVHLLKKTSHTVFIKKINMDLLVMYMWSSHLDNKDMPGS